MPAFWLRVALSLYGVGLIYALVSLWGGRQILTRVTMPAVGLGMTFHFVAIIEGAMMTGAWTPSSMHELESLLAFVLMVFFFVITHDTKQRRRESQSSRWCFCLRLRQRLAGRPA